MILALILVYYAICLIPVVIFLAVFAVLFRKLSLPSLASVIIFTIISSLLVAPVLVPASYLFTFQPFGVWLFAPYTFGDRIGQLGSFALYFQISLAIVSTLISLFFASVLFSRK